MSALQRDAGDDPIRGGVDPVGAAAAERSHEHPERAVAQRDVRGAVEEVGDSTLMGIVAATAFASGSTRVTVCRRVLETHTAPPPTAMPPHEGAARSRRPSLPEEGHAVGSGSALRSEAPSGSGTRGGGTDGRGASSSAARGEGRHACRRRPRRRLEALRQIALRLRENGGDALVAQDLKHSAVLLSLSEELGASRPPCHRAPALTRGAACPDRAHPSQPQTRPIRAPGATLTRVAQPQPSGAHE